MRTPALLVAGLLAVGACATSPAMSVSPTETVADVCVDVNDLVVEIMNAKEPLMDSWAARTDQLGVRAASIGTDDGMDLMDGLAALSVGISEVDIDLTLDGLDKIAAVCL